MKNTFSLTILIFLLMNSYGQLGNKHPFINQITTPSPEVTNFGKFGNILVGPSTGLPQINVPLENIKIGSIVLPISTDYQAGGIKVYEVSSSVGLGWALNAGGIITRALSGQPDKATSIGYWSSMVPAFSAVNASPSTYYQYLYSSSNGEADNSPDLFIYDLPGLSGCIQFRKDGSVFQIPLNNNKIEKYSSSNGLSFRIKDEIGRIYEFESSETFTFDSVNNSQPISPFKNAWYLTRIVDNNLTYTIYFTYETGCSGTSVEKTNSFSQEVGTILRLEEQTPFQQEYQRLVTIQDQVDFSTITQMNSFAPLNLKTIIWREGKVEFINVFNRTECPDYERRLSEVQV